MHEIVQLILQEHQLGKFTGQSPDSSFDVTSFRELNKLSS